MRNLAIPSNKIIDSYKITKIMMKPVKYTLFFVHVSNVNNANTFYEKYGTRFRHTGCIYTEFMMLFSPSIYITNTVYPQ